MEYEKIFENLERDAHALNANPDPAKIADVTASTAILVACIYTQVKGGVVTPNACKGKILLCVQAREKLSLVGLKKMEEIEDKVDKLNPRFNFAKALPVCIGIGALTVTLWRLMGWMGF